jgi:hypothetical protein
MIRITSVPRICLAFGTLLLLVGNYLRNDGSSTKTRNWRKGLTDTLLFFGTKVLPLSPVSRSIWGTGRWWRVRFFNIPPSFTLPFNCFCKIIMDVFLFFPRIHPLPWPPTIFSRFMTSLTDEIGISLYEVKTNFGFLPKILLLLCRIYFAPNFRHSLFSTFWKRWLNSFQHSVFPPKLMGAHTSIFDQTVACQFGKWYSLAKLTARYIQAYVHVPAICIIQEYIHVPAICIM